MVMEMEQNERRGFVPRQGSGLLRFGFGLLRHLALLLVLTAAGISPAWSAQGVITGQVLSEESAEGIPNADIVVTGRGEHRTTSGAEGRFRIAGVAPGRAEIRVLAIGYLARSVSVTVAPDDSVGVEIRLTPGVIMVPDVVVTAAPGLDVTGSDLAASTAVLSSAQLDQIPATAADDYLRGVPSVQVPLVDAATNFPAMPSFSIRGLGVGDNATRGLLLLNQRPSNGAFFGNVWWYRVPVQDLDRIEVIRGGSSGLFGSYAMAGTVHFRTRPVPSERTLRLEAKGGALGVFEADVFGGGPVSDAIRLGAGVNYSRTDGYISLPEDVRGSIDRKAGVEAFSGRVGAEFDVTSSTTLELHGDILNDERTGTTHLSPKDVEVASGGASVTRHFASGARVAVAADYLHEHFSTANTSLVTFGDRSEEYVSNYHVTPADDFLGSVVYTTPASTSALVTLGADARLVDGKDDADIYTSSGFAFKRIGQGKQRAFGLFGQVQWSPTDRVNLSAATRGDFFRNYEGSVEEDGVTQNFPDRSFTEVSPRLGLRYVAYTAPNRQVALRVAGYRAFRSPNLSNLYRTFGTTTFVGLANPALDPEILVGADGGADTRFGPVAFQVNGFWNEVEDFIGDVIVGFSPFTVERQNVGTLRTSGAELITNASLGGAWFAEFSFVYTDAKIVSSSDPELEGNRGEGAPEEVWTAAVGLAPPYGFGAQLRARRLGGQYQDVSNGLFIRHHFVMDAAARYANPAGWEVFAEGKNILDEEYVVEAEAGGLAAPVQVLGGVRIRLGRQ
jgi:iron complex outermembrane receptor protein